MLKLRLSPIFLGTRITLGPAARFRFERNVVREEDEASRMWVCTDTGMPWSVILLEDGAARGVH